MKHTHTKSIHNGQGGVVLGCKRIEPEFRVNQLKVAKGLDLRRAGGQKQKKQRT